MVEKEQEILAHEQSRVTLADAIKNVVAAFPLEVGQADEDSLAKVARLAKITQDLQCQVEDLQARQILSTPPEVLVEIRTIVSEAATNIKYGEAICAKVADNVVTIWETLLEDDTTEKIRQCICKADQRIVAAKVDMRKLPL